MAAVGGAKYRGWRIPTGVIMFTQGQCKKTCVEMIPSQNMYGEKHFLSHMDDNSYI